MTLQTSATPVRHSLFKTLPELLQARQASTRSMRFVRGEKDETEVLFCDHYQQSLRVLAELQSQGVTPGAQLVLQLSNYRAFLEVFWACVLGGIVPVPIAVGNADQHRRKLFHVFDKLEAGWLVTDTTQADRLAEFAKRESLADAYVDIQAQTVLVESLEKTSLLPEAADVITEVDPEALAFIQFSSGSTSSPKGVALTHRNLLTNLNAMHEGMDLDGDTDVMLSWMPLTHDMGLIGMHLLPVFGDVSSVLMPTDLFVRRPGLWMLKAHEHRATILCSPNFGFQHYLKAFKPDRVDGLDLSSIRLIFNGAEPISTDLCRHYMQTLAPYGLKADAMLPVYGLAEACLAVTFPKIEAPYRVLTLSRSSLGLEEQVIAVDEGSDNSTQFVCEGFPVQDCELDIRSTTGESLPEKTIGRLCIRGGNVTAGYYREPEINEQLITDDGWLDTGDLGFVEGGALFVTGRAKDIIFVSGQNHYPHDLEEIVIRAGLVDAGKVAVSSERAADNDADNVIAFIQFRGDEAAFAPLAADVRQVINEASGVPVHCVAAVPRVPKTTSGKVQRFELIRQYQAGDFQLQSLANTSGEKGEIHQPAASEPEQAPQNIQQQLLAICVAEMDGASCGVDDNLFEIGISSLTLATIHERIDESWPGIVDITDLFDHPTVAELAIVLESRVVSS